jgi:DNA polymerase III sliding clamp (beta) subunit (PCNA family)
MQTIINTLTVANVKNLVSRDDLRPAMNGVYIDTEACEIVATDGHKLVVFPLILDEQPKQPIKEIVPVECFPAKISKFSYMKFSETASGSNVEADTDGTTVKRGTIFETFPNYKIVFPKERTPIERIKVDLRLFADLYASLKPITGKSVPVVLEFHGQNRGIKFRNHAENIHGLIMPMTMTEEDL